MDLVSQAMFALLLSVPVACVVWTVTQEEIFREIREALDAFRKHYHDSFWRSKLAYLPTCPYCFSHYVSAFFVLLFDFRMLMDDWRGYLASVFTLVLVSNVYLSGYQILRITLRRHRAMADRVVTEGERDDHAPPRRFPPEVAEGPFRRKAAGSRRDEGRTVRFPDKTASR